MKQLMREQKPLALIPGGFEEATIHSSRSHRVYLKNRKGFVKYALQAGYHLVPCYCFGESETFSNIQGAWSLRLWLNKQGMVGVVPFGTWWCPFMPRNKRMHIVVGEPLELPQIEYPTNKQIDEHHKSYISKLSGLFDRHKGDYGMDAESMEIW
jgi:1-acyl-sn-glycerol-3-phosphate acyltransferase